MGLGGKGQIGDHLRPDHTRGVPEPEDLKGGDVDVAGALTDLAQLGAPDYVLDERADPLAGLDYNANRTVQDFANTLTALEAAYHCIPTQADGDWPRSGVARHKVRLLPFAAPNDPLVILRSGRCSLLHSTQRAPHAHKHVVPRAPPFNSSPRLRKQPIETLAKQGHTRLPCTSCLNLRLRTMP